MITIVCAAAAATVAVEASSAPVATVQGSATMAEGPDFADAQAERGVQPRHPRLGAGVQHRQKVEGVWVALGSDNRLLVKSGSPDDEEEPNDCLRSLAAKATTKFLQIPPCKEPNTLRIGEASSPWWSLGLKWKHASWQDPSIYEAAKDKNSDGPMHWFSSEGEAFTRIGNNYVALYLPEEPPQILERRPPGFVRFWTRINPLILVGIGIVYLYSQQATGILYILAAALVLTRFCKWRVPEDWIDALTTQLPVCILLGLALLNVYVVGLTWSSQTLRVVTAVVLTIMFLMPEAWLRGQ
jgi:hypothetical protein